MTPKENNMNEAKLKELIRRSVLGFFMWHLGEFLFLHAGGGVLSLIGLVALMPIGVITLLTCIFGDGASKKNRIS